MTNPMPANFANHPKCGAHCRTTGQPCRQPAMANGRCKMHGGKSKGRPVIHGRYTKAAKAQRQAARLILRTIRHLLVEIED